ncbi:hypothetical protein L1987_37965 [Smallanthus sonchifolius]|uniref:Uncharacterized protein n=1 Tax=Smallanthus sonchifolius TaxID=185202 RepID=A0ACB9HHL7_9ASTR|nr:hypothetical protein L1987_37965 [Smallanthus sonchifolius]
MEAVCCSGFEVEGRRDQSSLDAIHFSSRICIVEECGIETSMEGPSGPFQWYIRSDFQCTPWIQSEDDVFVVYRGLDLGNPLFGRVDGGDLKVLHMRDVYGGVDG